MRPRTIGTRLTLWYAMILGAALLLFSGGVWFALDHSLYHAVDESLLDRVSGVGQFIEDHSDVLSLEEIKEEFREHSVLGPGGDLFQVADANGNWLYRSDALYDEYVPIYPALELGGESRFENLIIQETPLRFLSRNITVSDQLYTVQVAAPLEELREGLRDFIWLLLPAFPIVLLVASAGGYWMSRRALSPVDEITRTARSIGADNLSRRLTVPHTGDELERLSQTLNEMITRLEAAFGRISNFTADASHELRTPLAIIRTTAEVALRDRGDGEEQREALEQIIAEVERTSQLVDNLLTMAKADSGETQLHRKRLELSRALQDVCSQAEALTRAKGITFAASLPEEQIWVEGDAQALHRLFLILIDNAVKYTPVGGEVEISLSESDGFAVAAVKDTGIGIPEADLPHIFERFYRVDKARSREQGGVGLGLAIGRWIVNAHGGELTAKSAQGEGSVFMVRLPIGAESQQRSR